MSQVWPCGLAGPLLKKIKVIFEGYQSAANLTAKKKILENQADFRVIITKKILINKVPLSRYMMIFIIFKYNFTFFAKLGLGDVQFSRYMVRNNFNQRLKIPVPIGVEDPFPRGNVYHKMMTISLNLSQLIQCSINKIVHVSFSI